MDMNVESDVVSHPPLLRPRKISDISRVVPDLSRLSLHSNPLPVSSSLSHVGDFDALRVPGEEVGSRSADTPPPPSLAPRPSTASILPAHHSPFVRPRKTADNSKALKYPFIPSLGQYTPHSTPTSDLDVIMSPPTSTPQASETVPALPMWLRERKTADQSKALQPSPAPASQNGTIASAFTPEIRFSPPHLSIPGGSSAADLTAHPSPILRPRKNKRHSNVIPRPQVVSTEPLTPSAPSPPATVSPATTSAVDDSFGRLRMASYSHAAAMRALLKFFVYPRNHHLVDAIPYTAPTAVSPTAERYPGCSWGGKLSHMNYRSIFSHFSQRLAHPPLHHQNMKPLRHRSTGVPCNRWSRCQRRRIRCHRRRRIRRHRHRRRHIRRHRRRRICRCRCRHLRLYRRRHHHTRRTPLLLTRHATFSF